MAHVLSFGSRTPFPSAAQSQNPSFKLLNPKHSLACHAPIKSPSRRYPILIKANKHSNPKNAQGADNEVDNLGVQAALSMLKFYKREISPLLPKSCRFVPTCSEYSMEAYKKYGVVKGTVLTAWRLCRCNPLGTFLGAGRASSGCTSSTTLSFFASLSAFSPQIEQSSLPQEQIDRLAEELWDVTQS